MLNVVDFYISVPSFATPFYFNPTNTSGYLLLVMYYVKC